MKGVPEETSPRITAAFTLPHRGKPDKRIKYHKTEDSAAVISQATVLRPE